MVSRIDYWSSGGRWETFVTHLDGEKWAPAILMVGFWIFFMRQMPGTPRSGTEATVNNFRKNRTFRIVIVIW